MEVEINNLEEMCDLMCDNSLPVKQYKYCLRCGRKLKSTQARELGYGQVCYKKIKNESKLHRKLF